MPAVMGSFGGFVAADRTDILKNFKRPTFHLIKS